MASGFSKQLQMAKRNFDNLRATLVVRVWNLAKRLDPKQMSEEKKKKGFSKSGNKGNS